MDDAVARDLGELAAAVYGILFVGAAAAKVEGFASWAALVSRFPISLSGKRAASVGVPVAEVHADTPTEKSGSDGGTW